MTRCGGRPGSHAPQDRGAVGFAQHGRDSKVSTAGLDANLEATTGRTESQPHRPIPEAERAIQGRLGITTSTSRTAGCEPNNGQITQVLRFLAATLGAGHRRISNYSGSAHFHRDTRIKVETKNKRPGIFLSIAMSKYLSDRIP